MEIVIIVLIGIATILYFVLKNKPVKNIPNKKGTAGAGKEKTDTRSIEHEEMT